MRDFTKIFVAALAMAGASAAWSQSSSAWYYYNGGQRQILTPDGTTSNITMGSASSSPRAAGTPALPVFREGDSPAGRRMVPIGGVVVQFQTDWSPNQVAQWLDQRGLQVQQRLNLQGNWYLIRSEAGLASVNFANAIHESNEVLSASPNWWKATVVR